MLIHPRFNPSRTYQDIERFKVTKFLGVPTVYRALLNTGMEKERDLSSLKVCAIGGEKTTPELMALCKSAGFSLRQIMGQTETSILLWASEEESLRKPGTVGRPVFHAEVNLVDTEGHQVQPGEVGEILVRGSIMMKEYWRDPVRTEETIKNGWLRTGDLARMDEEGYFYLVDRAKDMYISGGENVYPAEVERVLRGHPDIDDVAVVGVPDEIWGETGHAFIILKPGSCLCTDDVAQFCNGKLARYKWPKKRLFARIFPVLLWGKFEKSYSAVKMLKITESFQIKRLRSRMEYQNMMNTISLGHLYRKGILHYGSCEAKRSENWFQNGSRVIQRKKADTCHDPRGRGSFADMAGPDPSLEGFLEHADSGPTRPRKDRWSEQKPGG
jgi:fatty-acyl-CoA synthase